MVLFFSSPHIICMELMQPSIVVMLIFTIPWLSSLLIIDRTAPPAAGRSPAWSARDGCQVRATTAESPRRGETDTTVGQTASQSTLITLVLIQQFNQTKYKSNKSLQKELNKFFIFTDWTILYFTQLLSLSLLITFSINRLVVWFLKF